MAEYLRPFRAVHSLGHHPGALPRAGTLRAVGASSCWILKREKLHTIYGTARWLPVHLAALARNWDVKKRGAN